MASTVTSRIDGLSTSVAVKAPVQASTTGEIALSGLGSQAGGGWGASLAEGDRVLVKDQSDAKDNGIYVATSTGWSRAKDFDGARDVVKGTTVALASTGDRYRVASENPIVIGTSSLLFQLHPNDGRVIPVTSRAEMKTYDLPAGYQFSLDEGGRSGPFVVRDSSGAGFLIIKSITSSSVDATSDTITSTAHGLVNGDGVKPTTSVNGLTAGQLYWVVGATANTFQLSLTYGGAAVDLTGTTNFTVDHMFDPLEGIYVLLDNGNYVERTYEGPVKGGWFGANEASSTNTASLQSMWDFVSSKGVGGAQVEHEYEIESPLDLTKGNIRDRINVVLSGPGAIKKATSFTGDRLINIASDDFDEDNLILFHLSIDGVDKSVNGVDFFDENEPFDSNPTTATNTVYSKAVRFDNCNFNNCYRGARVTGNSNTFSSCTFWQNACGTFNTAAANDIRYIGCSFRRGGVGAHIKTASASLGTVGTQFVGCIFESNEVTGLALDGRPNDVGLHGFYFENNGFNLASTDYTSMTAPAEPCHIYSFGPSNGGGLTTLTSGEFWPSPAGVVHVYGTQISRFAFINTPATVKSTNIFAENTAVGKFDLSSVDVSAASLSQSEALLTINDKSYYAIGTTLKEFFPAELFQIGASSTTTVATTNTDADVYEIVAENGPNNAVKLIAHRGSSTVVEMALMGTATGKPTAAWSGDSLQVTAGTAATNRVVVTKVMII